MIGVSVGFVSWRVDGIVNFLPLKVSSTSVMGIVPSGNWAVSPKSVAIKNRRLHLDLRRSYFSHSSSSFAYMALLGWEYRLVCPVSLGEATLLDRHSCHAEVQSTVVQCRSSVPQSLFRGWRVIEGMRP
eukprot:scaffold39964_cov50-Attheya_sp.AAC.6